HSAVNITDQVSHPLFEHRTSGMMNFRCIAELNISEASFLKQSEQFLTDQSIASEARLQGGKLLPYKIECRTLRIMSNHKYIVFLSACASTWLQYAPHFGQRFYRLRKMLQDIARVGQIKCIIYIWKRMCVTARELHCSGFIGAGQLILRILNSKDRCACC